MALQRLACVDASGNERTFWYEFERPSATEDEWHFRVYLNNPPQIADRFFELNLRPLGTNSLYISMINHHQQPWYKAWGSLIRSFQRQHALSDWPYSPASAGVAARQWTCTELWTLK